MPGVAAVGSGGGALYSAEWIRIDYGDRSRADGVVEVGNEKG